MAVRVAVHQPSPDRTQGVWLDSNPDLSCTNSTPDNAVDVEHQPTDLAVGGSIGRLCHPPGAGRDGYLLTRFAINYCAADATALKVAIHGDPVPRAPDTWLEVEGRWQQRANDDSPSETPLLLAESIRVIEQPSPPYESGFPF